MVSGRRTASGPRPQDAAMIRIQLTDAERDRLDAEFRASAVRTYRDRLQIVRMAHRGRPHLDIAADLGVSARTVQRWLNAYLGRGLHGLRPRTAPGAAGHIPRSLDPVIRQWV